MSDRDRSGTYELITPPALKSRVGVGAGIDAELAKRANSAVQHMRSDFLQRTAAAAAAAAEASARAERSGEGSGEIADEIARTFRDLEKQSEALGFALMGNVCASLCRYTEQLGAADAVSSKIVSAHTDALRSAAHNAIDGDGGAVGRSLIESLNELVARG